MKSRIIPVILTAALTSVGTLYVAGRFADRNPYFTAHEAPSHNQSAYAAYAANTGDRMAPADFQFAAENSVKAVVHIKTQTKARTVVVQDPYGDDFFGQLFGQRQYYQPPQKGSGSGVVISPDGYIVTNNHVVANADEVTVTFNDRYTATAKLIATDPSTDIAILKVNEKNLPYLEFGNSDDVKLGQWVLAVGYPLTLDATVTAGIVSAKSRSIGINRSQSGTPVESFIQTDAAVNPGNSGGALVNTDGQLIGINSAIASPTGSYAGYSYAIPANIVRKVTNDLVEFGKVQRGFLSVSLIDRKMATPEQLTALGIDRTDGVFINGVDPSRGAGKAGLKKGDFITHVNGTPVATEPQLQEQVARYHPGDNVSVTYLRNGVSKTVSVQLTTLDGSTKMTTEPAQQVDNTLGASMRALTSEEKNKYNVGSGVVVTNVGKGALASTEMPNGFVITSVNDVPVKSTEDIQRIIANSNGNIQIGGIRPGYKGMYYYGIRGLKQASEE